MGQPNTDDKHQGGISMSENKDKVAKVLEKVKKYFLDGVKEFAF